MRAKPFIASLLMVVSPAAIAQAPPAPATPPLESAPPAVPRSADCTPTQPGQSHGSLAPEGSTTGQAREPLGDKLARSDGVLCPPSGIDPEMRAPAPDVGKTPVIPPPGSPGGNPSLRPK